MALTQAQQAAVDARNPELLVSAAAGSGKTRVLIERIFGMLEKDGLSLDRMLIVTFTHAAAAEMRERLQARIAEAAAGDPCMRAQAELLENAQISTLHSFCHMLIRAYFQEADVDPQAMLADEAQCAALTAQAKDDALDALYERAAKGEENAAAFTAKFDEKQILAMLDELYPFLMGLPEPFEWLAQCAQRTYTEGDLARGELAETLKADCALTARGVLDLALDIFALMDDVQFPEKYREMALLDGQAAEALSEAVARGLPEAGAAARTFSLMRLPTVRGLDGAQTALKERYQALRDGMKKLAAALAERVPQDMPAAVARLNAMQPALRGLCDFAADFDARYGQLKRARTMLDFHDLERMALAVLRNPDIRREVAARYDGVFVDEYQDISGVQEAILGAVKRDVSRETQLGPQYFFYVGDVKQSIYRFRQADLTLFLQKAKMFRPEDTAPQRRITLNRNFRSRQSVLAGVNRVFERVMREDVTELGYGEEERLYPGVPSAGDPPVSLHLFTQPVRAADRYRLQAYAIAREIRRRVGEPLPARDGEPAGVLRYRDIAILGPKMKNVSATLERVLAEMGIPVYSEERASAMESEEIGQALTHLSLLDNIADDLSLIAWLRSPAGGFGERELCEVRLRMPDGPYLDAVRAAAASHAAGGSDAVAALCARALDTLEHERFLLSETPLDQYLWGWLSRSGLYAFYGCQPGGKLRQANLRMLCERAGEHVKRRGGELSDFLRGAQAQIGVRDSGSPTVLSPWEDVVRVMTIHKSKGLEFPVVFVMGLEEGFGSRRGTQALAHAKLGVALPYVNEAARTTGDTVLGRAVALRKATEARAEKARLLYVAMTRARDELILLGCAGGLTPDMLPPQQAEGAQPSAYAVFGAGSLLDWVRLCLTAADTAVTAEGEEKTTNSPVWETGSPNGFSTQSTYNPQKTGVWKLVFHSQESELKAAQRLARGNGALNEPGIRKARLQALAEDARLLHSKTLAAARADGLAASPASEAAANGPAQGDSMAAIGSAIQRAQDWLLAYPAENGAGDGRANVGMAGMRNAALTRDPVAPPLHFAHHPFKVGATALARAEREAAPALVPLLDAEEGDPAQAELPEHKRLPLPLTRPRLMADLPAMPAFLQPPAGQTGLRRGVATHRALSLLRYDGLRIAAQGAGLLAEVQAQLGGFAARGLMTADEAALVDAQAVAAFFESPCGRGALAADTVRREWSFNLRLPERQGLIVQGVIDLCYLAEGAWVLVDYKTDRVASPAELWALYGGQMALYRRALQEATGLPVREITLYSLAAGAGDVRITA